MRLCHGLKVGRNGETIFEESSCVVIWEMNKIGDRTDRKEEGKYAYHFLSTIMSKTDTEYQERNYLTPLCKMFYVEKSQSDGKENRNKIQSRKSYNIFHIIYTTSPNSITLSKSLPTRVPSSDITPTLNRLFNPIQAPKRPHHPQPTPQRLLLLSPHLSLNINLHLLIHAR
jgi:hypothetical protein